MSVYADEKEYQRHELVERTGSGGCTVQTTASQRRQLKFDTLGSTWPVQSGEHVVMCAERGRLVIVLAEALSTACRRRNRYDGMPASVALP